MKKRILVVFAILFVTELFSFNVFAQAPVLSPVVNNKLQLIKVNINRAQVDEFTKLKGIGQKKAQAIVLYRKTHGMYQSLNDLLKVKGIGSKFLLANKTALTL